MKHKKFIIAGIILFIALGALIYVAFGGSISYYETVSELKEQGETVYGKQVKVHGYVVEGSMVFDDENISWNFIMFNKDQPEDTLSIVYDKHQLPDALKEGEEGNGVTVEGELISMEEFHAHTLMTSCPSKYESKVN